MLSVTAQNKNNNEINPFNVTEDFFKNNSLSHTVKPMWIRGKGTAYRFASF